MTAALVSPSPPDAAHRLGYAALVPFVGCALLVWLVRPEVRPYAALALSSYAAVIVALLGGIHWGIGFRESAAPASLFIWGAVPPLVAWIAAMMPPSAGLVIHGVMLWTCYAVDRRVYAQHGLGAWLTLRFRVSAVAGMACFIGAAGS